MRKIWYFILVIVALTVASCCPNNAIGQEATYTVDKSKLSASTIVELEQQEANKKITQTLEQYNEWAGIGQEVGIAVREGLTAVTDVAVDFSETNVGELTMFLIIWKIAGMDIIQIFVGLLLFIISTVIVTRSYFRTFKRKILIEGGWRQPKKWEEKKVDDYWDNPNAAAFLHFIVLMVFWITSSIVMFS